MLRMTRRAVNHIEDLRARRGHDAQVGVRFVARGRKVGMTFASRPETGDRVVPCDGILVYVASDVAKTFEESIIDAQSSDDRTRLVIRRKASLVESRTR